MIVLGVLVDFISIPVTVGFTSATSVIIAVSQFKGLLGLKFSSSGFLDTLTKVVQNLHKVRGYDCLLSFICIVVLIALRVSNCIPFLTILSHLITILLESFSYHRLRGHIFQSLLVKQLFFLVENQRHRRKQRNETNPSPAVPVKSLMVDLDLEERLGRDHLFGHSLHVRSATCSCTFPADRHRQTGTARPQTSTFFNCGQQSHCQLRRDVQRPGYFGRSGACHRSAWKRRHCQGIRYVSSVLW